MAYPAAISSSPSLLFSSSQPVSVNTCRPLSTQEMLRCRFRSTPLRCGSRIGLLRSSFARRTAYRVRCAGGRATARRPRDCRVPRTPLPPSRSQRSVDQFRALFEMAASGSAPSSRIALRCCLSSASRGAMRESVSDVVVTFVPRRRDAMFIDEDRPRAHRRLRVRSSPFAAFQMAVVGVQRCVVGHRVSFMNVGRSTPRAPAVRSCFCLATRRTARPTSRAARASRHHTLGNLCMWVNG